MHRTTARFWSWLARLPEPVQRLARQNFEQLKENPRIPPSISRKSGIYGPQGLGSITAPPPSRTAQTSSGSGLAPTTSISE